MIDFRAESNAVATVKRIALPGLRPAAAAIAIAIPANAPVHRGVMRRNYHPRVEQHPPDAVRVYPGSPFWHWLEYGTRFNPAYRVIENAVRSLRMRYLPQ